MKKLWGLIAALVVVFIGLTIVLSLMPISDSEIYSDFEVDYGYKITSADYNITVSEDHTATVVETISVLFIGDSFNRYSRGIVRWLPTTSGEQYTDISVEGDEYYVTSEVNFVGVYTGNDYDWKYGPGSTQTYIIKYKIVPPVRTIKKTNYYMNVVPFGWNTTQSNVTLTMNFPFEIKDEMVYMGKYGVTQTTKDYTLSGDKKTLSMFIDSLEPFAGVTVDAEMGRTFSVNFSLSGFLAIVVVLALIALCVSIKLFVVKDREVFPIINANPPHDGEGELDPAQMGYLIDNNCEPKDITAMIFYFAAKGLIKLESKGKDSFILVKSGELPLSAPLHQKIVFNGLFKGRDRVTTAQLQNTFYTVIASATSTLKSKYSGKLYEAKSKAASIFTAVISTVFVAFISVLMAVRINITLVIRSFLAPIIAMAVFAVLGFLAGRYLFDNKHKLSQKKLISLSLGAAIVAAIASIIASYFLLGGIFPLYGRIIIFAGIAVICFVCGLINRKTEYYTSLMNEITGFKTFLETAKKEKLEEMLESNPQYYYDILPYANVLGVSSKWEEKFKGLTNVPPPNYYYGPTVFDFMLFNSMMRSSYARFTTAMVSRPSGSSSSGRGGFGGFGGGFGGGGFGGGGGGRR